MQDRPLLCGIDLLAAEHGIDSRLKTGFFCELKKEPEGLVDNAVLGVIEVQACSLDCHPLAALRVVSEKLTQMQL